MNSGWFCFQFGQAKFYCVARTDLLNKRTKNESLFDTKMIFDTELL